MCCYHCRDVECYVDFHFQPVLNVWEKFFGCRTFSGVVPLLLPLYNDFLSFLMLYLTFWDFAVAYVTTSGGLLSEFVCTLIFVASCFCTYPSIFYVPIFFLQAMVFFLISSMRCFRFFVFLIYSRVILLSVCIISVLGMLLFIFIVSIAYGALTIAICSA